MVNRRELSRGLAGMGISLAGLSVLGLAGCSPSPDGKATFITTKGQQFIKDGAPYYYVGANLWYAAYAASPDPAIGNPGRLERELDALSAMGVTNLRLLASSELSPLKNSLNPAFQSSDGSLNEGLLKGLDKALALMAERNMTAILYLTNFWEWSGGLGTYEAWTNGGSYIDMNDPAHPWPAFPDFVSQFYENQAALAKYEAYVRTLVTRTNSVTNKPYKDDPTIMSWQLCNEPRPGGTGEIIAKRFKAYKGWIDRSAALIKSLDPNHLVSVGHEGPKGSNDDLALTQSAQDSPNIDYTTAHIWPQNWSWADPKDLEGSFPIVAKETTAYIANSVTITNTLKKPLVIEEFGFPRDDASYEAGTSTVWRDQFYGLIIKALLESHQRGGEIAGINFWAWGGEGRALHDDYRMKPKETAYVGDPPHEPQGWYSVFDTDAATKTLLSDAAQKLAEAKAP
jgi:mannan endo-1,4-beta-mannosidase